MPTPTAQAMVATMRDAANVLEAAAGRAAATPAQHILTANKALPAPVPEHLRPHFELMAAKGWRLARPVRKPPEPILDLEPLRAILARRQR